MALRRFAGTSSRLNWSVSSKTTPEASSVSPAIRENSVSLCGKRGLGFGKARCDALLPVWLSQDAARRVTGDQQFLVSGDHMSGQARVFAADHSFRADRLAILFAVD